MKSYLPYLWAGLWLLGSCSTPEPDPVSDVPGTGIELQYTLIPNPEISGSLTQISADATGMDLLPQTLDLPSSEEGLVRHQDPAGLSLILSQSGCKTTAVWYDSGTGDILQRAALDGVDGCTTEVRAVAHQDGTLYLLYVHDPSDTEQPQYGLRALPMAGGEPADQLLEEEGVDLEVVAGRIQVLTRDQAEPVSYTLRAFDKETLAPVGSSPVGFDAKMILRLGTGQLLVAFEDAHLILQGTTLETIQNIRYQEGTAPGFIGQAPWASKGGDRIYYTYLWSGTGASGRIGGVYEIDRRTLVLYAFENFLSPTQRDFQYDVGEATAVGMDVQNDLLLIGYQKASDPSRGGLLRLQTTPSLTFVDQIDLPAPPMAILAP